MEISLESFSEVDTPISFPTPTRPLRKQRSPQGGRQPRVSGLPCGRATCVDVTAGGPLRGHVRRKARAERRAPIRPPAPEAARL